MNVFEHEQGELLIEFESKEFTAICPFDGKPDSYKLLIRFMSNGLSVESQSLNDWLLTFRDQVLSAEELTGVIAYELNELLCPSHILVMLKQSIRSGLQLTVQKEINQ